MLFRYISEETAENYAKLLQNDDNMGDVILSFHLLRICNQSLSNTNSIYMYGLNNSRDPLKSSGYYLYQLCILY